MAEVISDRQRQLNRALHDRDEEYGAGRAKLEEGRLPAALRRMHELGCCHSVLDYGTGKGSLVERLRRQLPAAVQVTGYDPAVEAFARRPNAAADILTCLDVLEHVEHACIDEVLKEIAALTNQFCYLVIDLQPAAKTLPDGRNAHILLAPPEWWVGRVAQRFSCQASFPILHACGLPQKLVIAASHRNENLTLMYSFLIKLNVFSIRCAGGVLGGLPPAPPAGHPERKSGSLP